MKTVRKRATGNGKQTRKRKRGTKMEVTGGDVASKEDSLVEIEASNPKRSRKSESMKACSSENNENKKNVGASEKHSSRVSKVVDAANNSKKLIGYHVSSAGGVSNAVFRAVEDSCRAFALFIGSSRSWKSLPLSEDEVSKFEEAIKETAFPLENIVPHSAYIMNIASLESEILSKSRQKMIEECKNCERLQLSLYNFHPGSSSGKGSKEDAINNVIESINIIHNETGSVILLVETMAGQGSTLCGKFEDIATIIKGVNNKSRIGVCIDTCHIFAAGYDIRSKEEYEKTMEKFDSIIGFSYLRALHLNDSKGPLGSNLDRHENIGRGKIGIAGFKNFMADPRFDSIPMVLETPECDYTNEMVKLYSCC
ncbi:hypothetical protein AB6A40_004058 [Gnathostoma spinigerum]|uniref:Xylose isomerase-like TIM barrel domain-containing protein n=1 Tax=Gnathostoma spinigerum TaxID=75299 RepID=A0ABD6EGT5_9BILA